MLIKLSAGLGLIGAVLWSWQHRRRRLALTVVVATGAVVALGYLPVLAGASAVLGGADKTVTKASLWNLLVDRILHHDAGRNVLDPLVPNPTLSVSVLPVGSSRNSACCGTRLTCRKATPP